MYNRSYLSPLLLAYLASDKLNCVHDPTTELPGGVFIGNLEAAQSIDILKKNSIKAVLTVADGTNLSYKKQPYVQDHLILLADDVPSFDMTKHFNNGIEFIQNCRKKGYNILVHCHAGISRSSTMVLAYLMKHIGWSLQKCLSQVRKRRPIVQPNPGFLRQLSIFEKKIRNDSSSNFAPNKLNSSVVSNKKQQSFAFKRPSSLAPERGNDRFGQKSHNNFKQKQKLMQQELNNILVNKGLQPKTEKKQQKFQYKKQDKKQQKRLWGRQIFKSEPKINKTSKDPFRPKDASLLPNRTKPNYHFTQKNFSYNSNIVAAKDILGTFNRGSIGSKYPY